MESSGIYPRNRSFIDQSNPFTNKIFQDAVIRGDLAVIAILLKFGIVVRRNERNHQGLTALQQSVLDGNLRLAVRLLENGADIESKTSNGWSCLHIAAATGDAAMVHLLLSNCADVVALTKNEELPIDVAASLEVKIMLSQQLAKVGYSELAQWYRNKIASKEVENSAFMSPNHVLENACYNSNSSDLNKLPYCSHNITHISSPVGTKCSNISDPSIVCVSQTNNSQRKLSSWSLSGATNRKEQHMKEQSCHAGLKGRVNSPSCTLPQCGECGQMYMPEFEDQWAIPSDLVYLSCSSGYLSESNTESRHPSDYNKYYESHEVGSIDRSSVHSCSPSIEKSSYDNLRPAASNPVISRSPDIRYPDAIRTLPRVSRKPSCSTIASERKTSTSNSETGERKRSRIELFIDYFKDSLDHQLSDDDDEEDMDVPNFVVGSDDSEVDGFTEEESEDEPLSPDHYPSFPDQVSSTKDIQEIHAMSKLAGNDATVHDESRKLLQQESFQFLLDAMDRDIELPEQNMYFNPMYKSPPESSTDSQEKLSREGCSNTGSSGMLHLDQTLWHDSTLSATSRRSSLSSRTDNRRRKKSILSEIVSRLRDSVKLSRSNSDPELTDTEEPVLRRDTSSVVSIRDKRHVRRSNSFSSYFGSIHDSLQMSASSQSVEIKENIDPSCEYPEDYYFVDRSGQMMKRYKQSDSCDYKSSDQPSKMSKRNQLSYFGNGNANCPLNKDSDNNIPRDKQHSCAPASKENYSIESLVTPRLLRKLSQSTNCDCHETSTQVAFGDAMDDENSDSLNLYPHTIILNNGSLSPDTDDPDAALASNFQCTCRDCVLTVHSLRRGNCPPLARNTYQRRCHSMMNGASAEQGSTTSCMSFKFLCK